MKECSGLPGMISIYFSHISDEIVLIGMEYCSNGSLEMYINNAKENSEERIKSFSKQILLAMYNLIEKGIVHRDIKPENILIDEFGRLKLADFGLAKETNGQSKLSTKTIAGTKRYLSPELEDGVPQSEKSDVWALGVVILELAYGRDTYKDSEIIRMKSKKIKKEFKMKGGYSREMDRFLARCFEQESVIRATVEDLLQDKWFSDESNYPSRPIVNASNFLNHSAETFFKKSTIPPTSTKKC